MLTAHWLSILNLILDLMGYLLDLAFWVLVTWYAIGAVFLARFLGGPIYMTPGLVAVSVLMGLGCGWLSRGIYNRKIGRMMECFCFRRWFCS